MRADGAFGELKGTGNFHIGFTQGNLLQNLHFAGGQPLGVITRRGWLLDTIDQFLSHLGVQAWFSLGHIMNGLDQLLWA